MVKTNEIQKLVLVVGIISYIAVCEYKVIGCQRFIGSIRESIHNVNHGEQETVHFEQGRSQGNALQTNIYRRNQNKTCSNAYEASYSGYWKWFHNSPRWLPNNCTLVTPDSAEVNKILLGQNVGKIVLMGDSQTERLSQVFKSFLHCNGIRINVMNDRCLFGTYLGIERALKWRSPNRRLEGPCFYGVNHSGCADCEGCNAWWQECSYGPNPYSIEYLPVEFAKDVEIQSRLYNTTQLNVIDYLKRNGAPDVFIFNAGVHDLAYRNSTAYISSIKQVAANLLKAFPGTQYLFINTAAIAEWKVTAGERNITNNDNIKRQNDGAGRVMNTSNIPYIDNWFLSNNSFALVYLHNPPLDDPIHMSTVYYEHLVQLISLQLQTWFGK